MYTYETLLVALGAYLLGSIPFGIVLARLFGLPDPRTIGSGNIGATNMLRTGNKKVALLTLLLDAGKGAAAVYLSVFIFINFVFTASETPPQALLASLAPGALLAAAIGHMYSPWLKFNGGKGVATILGGLLALSKGLALVFCLVWLMTFFKTRYVSLASVLALASIPATLFGLRILDGHMDVITARALIDIPLYWSMLVYALKPVCISILGIASLVAIYKHRANIARLRAGTEPKMGGKKHAA